jgi:hypothetical protein
MVEATYDIIYSGNENLAMPVPRLKKAFMYYEIAFVGLFIDLNEIDPHTCLKVSSAAPTCHKERVARNPAYSRIFEVSSVLRGVSLV